MAYLVELSSGSHHHLGPMSTLLADRKGYAIIGDMFPDFRDGHAEIFLEEGEFRIINLTAEARVVRRGEGFAISRELDTYGEMPLQQGDEIEIEGNMFRFEKDIHDQIREIFREEYCL